jgi:DNA replication protein DnaC
LSACCALGGWNTGDRIQNTIATSEIHEATVRQLHRCEFIDGAQNIVLVSGPGTGKTHVATALGIQAIEHHRQKVRFLSTIELVNALEQEKAKGKSEDEPRLTLGEQ